MIKAFTITDQVTFRYSLSVSCDYRMYDSGAGTGIVFEHTLIGSAGDPYFLAGGLTPENVGEAISELHPYAVDTSSGIESNGRKNPVKMERFIQSVRKADHRREKK